MPNPWAMIDTSFPTFTGKESFKDQVSALQDYLYLVVEELKYQLSNLNTQNWNKVAMEKFQKDTTAETDEQVAVLAEQITQITNRLTLLGNSLNQLKERMNDAEEELPKLWEGLELLAGDVDDLKGVIRTDGGGGASIGTEGKDLKLIGNVYINGILVKMEESNGTA